jgi:hypothetical protein
VEGINLMKFTLDNFEVKNPCSMKWEEMNGNREIRHCDRCQHNIYNISEMTSRRALKVLNQPEEKVCVSYFLDEKKQVVTQTYLGIFKRNFKKAVGAILAIIFSFSSLYALQTKNPKPRKKKITKHRKHKKPLPPRPFIGKRAPKNKQIIGLRQ